MKLEVGMYVRYRWIAGQVKIGKIKEIDGSIICLNNADFIYEYNAKKISRYIIDVIEIGDYIEGTVEVIDKNDEWIIVNGNPRVIGKEEANGLIYSVETKEQFELNRLIDGKKSSWDLR